MRVLSIGTDRKLFKENSEVRKRVVEYGSLVDELHIVVFSKRKSQAPNSSFDIAQDKKFQILNSNVFVYPTNSRNRWFYVFGAIKIGKQIEKPDLITCQDPFECGLAGWKLAKYFGCKLQLQIHTDFLNLYFKNESVKNRIRVWLANFLIPKANCIRVVSERIKKSIISNFKFQISNLSVLPIWVDTEKIKNVPIKTDLRKKYPQFDFIILMASRLTKEKNIGLAIDVIKEIIKNHPKTGLIIVGNGTMKKNLMSQVSGFKFQKNIIFENWTNGLISYYKTCDLFLLTSNYEGYGMTLVEAVSAGCNVISSDVGVAQEILEKENIFEVGNREDLKQKVSSAINGLTKPSKSLKLKTKEEYLMEYKKSWTNCLKNLRHRKS